MKHEQPSLQDLLRCDRVLAGEVHGRTAVDAINGAGNVATSTFKELIDMYWSGHRPRVRRS